MFYCKVFTRHDCYEKCCFICPDLVGCEDQCGLSGIDDKCLYKDDENPDVPDLDGEIPLCGEFNYASI